MKKKPIKLDTNKSEAKNDVMNFLFLHITNVGFQKKKFFFLSFPHYY